MTDKPRATDNERIVSSNNPHKGAQVSIGENSVGMANQKGSGIIADGQFIGIQSDIINIMPRSVITIADAPLNEVAMDDTYSAEITHALGRDVVAGRVIWGVPSIHTHMQGSIRIPSMYRSRYANKIRELKSVIERFTPLLLAVGLSGLAAIALPAAFDVVLPDLPEPDDFVDNTEPQEDRPENEE